MAEAATIEMTMKILSHWHIKRGYYCRLLLSGGWGVMIDNNTSPYAGNTKLGYVVILSRFVGGIHDVYKVFNSRVDAEHYVDKLLIYDGWKLTDEKTWQKVQLLK